MDHLEEKSSALPRQMESEVVDLGWASEETRGGGWGVVNDSGIGFRFS